jgi:hypothetical protein
MQPQMKKPMYSGFGQRNNTTEALKIDRALKAQAEHDTEKLRKQRPQALPMAPGQRALTYIGRRATPAQRRRVEKKSYRWARGGPWHNLGLDVSTAPDGLEDRPELPEWDPTECSCHINPPCHYCTSQEFNL